jgi:hypothetical protein
MYLTWKGLWGNIRFALHSSLRVYVTFCDAYKVSWCQKLYGWFRPTWIIEVAQGRSYFPRYKYIKYTSQLVYRQTTSTTIPSPLSYVYLAVMGTITLVLTLLLLCLNKCKTKNKWNSKHLNTFHLKSMQGSLALILYNTCYRKTSIHN